jgi:hypothetical protein
MVNTKKIKRGDLLPWFLQDHDTLPQWYLEDCQKFFDWLKTQQGKYPELEHQARKKLN